MSLSCGRASSCFHRYMDLAVELRQEISMYAVHALLDDLRVQLECGRIHGTLSAAIYKYAGALELNVIRRVLLSSVVFAEDHHLRMFLRDVPVYNGIASAVVVLNIDVKTMRGGLNWKDFLVARRYMRRLDELAFSGVIIPDNKSMRTVVAGLQHLSLIYCTLGYQELAAALDGVPSFNARDNTITGTVNHVHQLLSQDFQHIELAAMSSQESFAYSLILSRVNRTQHLSLRGIRSGWSLGGNWDSVESCACLYGLPLRMNIHPRMKTLLFALSIVSLNALVPFLKPICRADIMLTIDVPIGSSLGGLPAFWEALDKCETENVRVVFNLDGRDHVDFVADHFSGLYNMLAESNVVGGNTLCAHAIISVVRLEGLDFYRSE
ncbi:hypothetical protein CYLTODRAFT_456605 [Cylindrobasidium torrendii FP15055 ss-10]|uniref:Uncharacterized protein n=1 Tax=Cylindrobasidium torrendii FP15055 ss-10 TaxID=1314674 RepID=A0A0D7B3M8_9AGAR|nr:hypothetical protein CYLTODRAFT_456605 [Cylindrobasidium torrendii FP15055 ss-10]